MTLSNVHEIIIASEHHEVVSDAKLGKECVYCSDLNPGAATIIPQFCGSHMIVAVWNQ